MSTITRKTKDVSVTLDGQEFDTLLEAQRCLGINTLQGELEQAFYWDDLDPREVARWLLANYDVVRKERV